jgi:hypothetical protein
MSEMKGDELEVMYREGRYRELFDEAVRWRAVANEAQSQLSSLVEEAAGKSEDEAFEREIEDSVDLLSGYGWVECPRGHWEHPEDNGGKCVRCDSMEEEDDV